MLEIAGNLFWLGAVVVVVKVLIYIYKKAFGLLQMQKPNKIRNVPNVPNVRNFLGYRPVPQL